MLSLIRYCRLPLTLVTVISVTGCQSMEVNPLALAGAAAGLAGGGFGGVRNLGRRPTSVGDVMSKVHTTMAIIAVVREFARLSEAQKQHVERTVERKYNGLVQKEKSNLAPTYVAKKAAVKKKARAEVARNPAAAPKIEAETAKEEQKVDLEWDKAAKSSVAKNYGTDFAVPVENSEGKPVVAFASVKDSGVSVSGSSYEVASNKSLDEGQKIKHSGRTYAVLDD